MGQQCLIDFVYRAAVRDLKLVISFIFDFLHMAANAGTDSGRNFCGRNAGEMVADSGTFSGGNGDTGKGHEQAVGTDHLEQLGLMDIHGIDPVVVDEGRSLGQENAISAWGYFRWSSQAW